MLNFTCLVFVVAVAVSWPTRGALAKRETEDEEKATIQNNLLKESIAGLLYLNAETPDEKDTLEDLFAAAMEKKWDSIDDYANHLVKIYQEVTGRSPGENIKSDQLLLRAMQFER